MRDGRHYNCAISVTWVINLSPAANNGSGFPALSDTIGPGLTEKALRQRPRSEATQMENRQDYAHGNHGVSRWIARRLDPGSASNVCHKMR
jgi:hypothetical protein